MTHRLLQRQLTRAGVREPLSAELQALLLAVEGAYDDSDRDRALLERSLDLTSDELVARNTELRSELNQRRESEANFRSLLDQGPDAIAVLHQDVLVYSNKAFSTLIDQPREALALARLRDVVDATSWGILNELLGENGRDRAELELGLSGRAPRKVEVRALALAQFGGRSARVLIARDLDQVHALQARLVASDRLASIGMLAAGVAHEVNNPLSFMISNVTLAIELIDKSGMAPEAAKELHSLLADVAQGGQRVRDIVRTLGLFARSEGNNSGVADLVGAIDSALSLAANELRHRAHVVKQIAHTGQVRGNNGRLAQLFLNLLLNAAQATSEGHAERNEIRVSTRDVGDDVEIVVCDSGTGIEPQHMAKLFQPFFTTKARGLGTGLGLSISQRIVSDAGGTIGIDSRLGKGTVVTVRLVRATALVATRPVIVNPKTGAPRGRVLIIDDEPKVALATARVLKSEHDVTVANSVAEALTLLREQPPFDLILSDLLMPELTGIDLYERLQQNSPDDAARLVLMTGGAFTPSARAFVESRRTPVLEKPMIPEDLRAFVRKFLGGHPQRLLDVRPGV